MQRRAVSSSNSNVLPIGVVGASRVVSRAPANSKQSSNGLLSIISALLVILLLGTGALLVSEKNTSKALQARLSELQDEHNQVSRQNASKSVELNRVKAEKEKLAKDNNNAEDKVAVEKGKADNAEKSQIEIIKGLNSLQIEVQTHSKHDVLEQ